ncbi:MAG: hypothetical protein AAF337_11835 [Pseudomonadota bacterium]
MKKRVLSGLASVSFALLVAANVNAAKDAAERIQAYDAYLQTLGDPAALTRHALQPGGPYLIVTEKRGETARDLFLFNTKTGQMISVYQPKKPATFASFEWTADGRGFYMVESLNKPAKALSYYDLTTGELTILEAPGSNVDAVTLGGGDRYIAWLVEGESNHTLVVRDLKVNRLVALPDMPPGITAIEMDDKSAALSIIVSGESAKTALWTYDIESKALTRAEKTSAAEVSKAAALNDSAEEKPDLAAEKISEPDAAKGALAAAQKALAAAQSARDAALKAQSAAEAKAKEQSVEAVPQPMVAAPSEVTPLAKEQAAKEQAQAKSVADAKQALVAAQEQAARAAAALAQAQKRLDAGASETQAALKLQQAQQSAFNTAKSALEQTQQNKAEAEKALAKAVAAEKAALSKRDTAFATLADTEKSLDEAQAAQSAAQEALDTLMAQDATKRKAVEAAQARLDSLTKPSAAGAGQDR